MCHVTVGSMTEQEVLPGEMADFNMWSVAMTAAEVNAMSCDTVGDVTNQHTLSLQGTLETVTSSTSCYISIGNSSHTYLPLTTNSKSYLSQFSNLSYSYLYIQPSAFLF